MEICMFCNSSVCNKVMKFIYFYREVEVDVCSITEPSKPPYDMAKAKTLMQECGRHVPLMRTEESAEDWEERISRFKQMSVGFMGSMVTPPLLIDSFIIM